MGSFLSQGKNSYFWFLLGYLADENVYIKDSSLIPYTPSKTQTYVAFYPQFYNAEDPQKLSFEINGIPSAYALITDPSGLVYFDIKTPKGRFELVTRAPNGMVLNREIFFAKNYAMLLAVMAQGYEDREAEIQANYADVRFSEIRSGRLYDVLGVQFDFPPPPGWPVAKYRAAILGGCGPGFIKSFFHGSTKKGVADTIKSITCEDPQILPARRGIRWVVRNRSNSFPTDPTARGFFITARNSTRTFTAPHYRAFLASRNWWANAADIVVTGSRRDVLSESTVRNSNSYFECPVAEPFNLDGLSLRFSIQDLGDLGNIRFFDTVFPLGTSTAALAAAAIVAQNPTVPTDDFYLNDAIYATPSGKLRIGVYPKTGKSFRVSFPSGTAMAQLGILVGAGTDVSNDHLDNPWLITGTLALDDADTPITTGFTIFESTGEIVWDPSTAANTSIPAAGKVLNAAYTYEMRREILAMVGKVQHVNSVIQFEWAS